MTRYETAIQTHRAGFNCCTCQLLAWRDKLGLSERQCYGIGSGMGGGLRTGEICGAVSGAVMVLGMLVPHDPDTLAAGKERNAALTRELQRRFAARFGAVCCRDLKGKQPRVSDTAARSGAETNCDQYIVAAVELLEEILKEEGI